MGAGAMQMAAAIAIVVQNKAEMNDLRLEDDCGQY
jgi:hypothetical protein